MEWLIQVGWSVKLQQVEGDHGDEQVANEAVPVQVWCDHDVLAGEQLVLVCSALAVAS